MISYRKLEKEIEQALNGVKANEQYDVNGDLESQGLMKAATSNYDDINNLDNKGMIDK